MEKLLHPSVGKNVALSLFLLLVLGVFGCSGVGRVIPVDHRLSFSDQGSGQGSFSQDWFKVEYSYSMVGENMTIDGWAYYRGGADSLVVRLLFLDASGTVLQEKIVYSSGYRLARSWKENRTFHRTLVVPPGVAGLSFSHFVQPRRSYK